MLIPVNSENIRFWDCNDELCASGLGVDSGLCSHMKLT